MELYEVGRDLCYILDIPGKVSACMEVTQANFVPPYAET